MASPSHVVLLHVPSTSISLRPYPHPTFSFSSWGNSDSCPVHWSWPLVWSLPLLCPPCIYLLRFSGTNLQAAWVVEPSKLLGQVYRGWDGESVGQAFPKETASGLTLQGNVASVIQEGIQRRPDGSTETSKRPCQEMPPTPRGHWRDTFDGLQEAVWEESKKANERGGDWMVWWLVWLSAWLD